MIAGALSQWLFAQKKVPDWLVLLAMLVFSCGAYVAIVQEASLAHGFWGVWRGGVAYMANMALGQMVTSKVSNTLVASGAANAASHLVPVSNSKP